MQSKNVNNVQKVLLFAFLLCAFDKHPGSFFCVCSPLSSPSHVRPLLSHNDIWSRLRVMLLLVAMREAVVTVT